MNETTAILESAASFHRTIEANCEAEIRDICKKRANGEETNCQYGGDECGQVGGTISNLEGWISNAAFRGLDVERLWEEYRRNPSLELSDEKVLSLFYALFVPHEVETTASRLRDIHNILNRWSKALSSDAKMRGMPTIDGPLEYATQYLSARIHRLHEPVVHPLTHSLTVNTEKADEDVWQTVGYRDMYLALYPNCTEAQADDAMRMLAESNPLRGLSAFPCLMEHARDIAEKMREHSPRGDSVLSYLLSSDLEFRCAERLGIVSSYLSPNLR